MSETMSRKEAQELVAGPLRFGDQRQLEAIALLEQIEKQHQGGPVIVCTECGKRKGGMKIHRIGCFLCADCTVSVDAHLASKGLTDKAGWDLIDAVHNSTHIHVAQKPEASR